MYNGVISQVHFRLFKMQDCRKHCVLEGSAQGQDNGTDNWGWFGWPCAAPQLV